MAKQAKDEREMTPEEKVICMEVGEMTPDEFNLMIDKLFMMDNFGSVEDLELLKVLANAIEELKQEKKK